MDIMAASRQRGPTPQGPFTPVQLDRARHLLQRILDAEHQQLSALPTDIRQYMFSKIDHFKQKWNLTLISEESLRTMTEMSNGLRTLP